MRAEIIRVILGRNVSKEGLIIYFALEDPLLALVFLLSF
jgi:hypothetical protein